jgi:predicted SprT family Zn-dependent metalloprotease
MITTVQFKTLDDLYRFYNKGLFAGKLAECIVNMSRKNGTYGFFVAHRWKSADAGEDKIIHEISLNPDHLGRPSIEWHATLVHEMCHLWQQDFGHPSRGAYHNKEWAYKMDTIGLIPSDTGEPGGKKTGQNMTHYINPEGAFMRIFNSLTTETLEALRIKYLPAFQHTTLPPRRRAVDGRTKGLEEPDNEGGGETEKYNSKTKYSCPCGNNVWGRPGLDIVCGECGEEFSET